MKAGFLSTLSKDAYEWTSILREKDITLFPKNNQKHTETLIFLHGLGHSAEDCKDLFFTKWNPASSTTKVILLTAPIAPISIYGGVHRHSWFDIRFFNYTNQGLNFEDYSSMEELTANTKRIHKVIDEEIKELGDSKRVIIGGISQGCAMALYAGLSYYKPLGGIVGLAGFYLPFTKTHEANRYTPIFIGHGTDDHVIPAILATLSYSIIDRNTHPITRIFENNLGHTINENLCKQVKKFIEKCLKKTIFQTKLWAYCAMHAHVHKDIICI